MDENIKPIEGTEPAAADNVVPINGAAAAIMENPAAAAGLTAAPTAEVMVQRVLDALPGLVGAIDHAIKDQTGKHQPFMLLVFAEGTALHSANFDPKVAQKALIELAGRWATGDAQAMLVPPGGGEAAPLDPNEAAPDVAPHATH